MRVCDIKKLVISNLSLEEKLDLKNNRRPTSVLNLVQVQKECKSRLAFTRKFLCGCAVVMNKIRYFLCMFIIWRRRKLDIDNVEIQNISGIGLIVAGSIVLADVGEFGHFMEGKILAPPVVLIVAGVIVFLVASLGCYGAIRESYYMLMAFAVCLLIIFIIEFAVGIAAATYKNEFRTVLKDSMKNSLLNYDISKSDKDAWDNVQTKLECCGVDGPADWPKRPASCCHAIRDNTPGPTLEHCKTAKRGDEFLFNYGCFDELQKKAESASKTLIGVGIGVAFIEIIGIILACWMASAVKNKE